MAALLAIARFEIRQRARQVSTWVCFAAMALLAKTYLYEQKWQLAASTAQAVEALGTYSLLPVFADNFRASTKNNAEAIFSVQHTAGLSPNQGNKGPLLCRW